MAKTDPAAPETSLEQAGMPPSYGMGIQQSMYGPGSMGSMNPMLGSLGSSNQNGMQSSGPSQNMFMRLMQGMANSQYPQQGGMFGGNGMGGRFGTGFMFGNPISSPNLFGGLQGMNGGGPGNQTTPLGASLGWSQQSQNTPQGVVNPAQLAINNQGKNPMG